MFRFSVSSSSFFVFARPRPRMIFYLPWFFSRAHVYPMLSRAEERQGVIDNVKRQG